MPVRLQLANLEELKQKRSIKFSYNDEGIQREGFLALHQGQVICYENVCRHLPLSLDYGDGQFFTADGRQIICQTHGAIYEPLTGQCVAGPCAGAALKKLAVQIENDTIWLLARAASESVR